MYDIILQGLPQDLVPDRLPLHHPLGPLQQAAHGDKQQIHHDNDNNSNNNDNDNDNNTNNNDNNTNTNTNTSTNNMRVSLCSHLALRCTVIKHIQHSINTTTTTTTTTR